MSKDKKTSVSSLTFKNYHIYSGNFMKKPPIVEILNVPLHGQQARSRNRIIKIFDERSAEVEASRMDLIKKFGKLDKNKEPELDPKTKSYILADEDGFKKEFGTLLEESCTFDVLPSNRADFQVVKELVLNCKVDFDINGTTVYEEICTIFESL